MKKRLATISFPVLLALFAGIGCLAGFNHGRQATSKPDSFSTENQIRQENGTTESNGKHRPRPENPADFMSGNDPLKALIALRKKNRPNYLLTDSRGILTSQAVTQLRLDPAQQAELQASLVEMRKGVRELLLRNMYKDEQMSEPQSTAYRIRPFSAESSLVLTNFFNRMANSVGRDGAIEIAKALNVEGEAGGFGAYETILKVKEPAPETVEGMSEEDIKKIHSVQYQYRDPETGKELGGGTSSIGAFNDKFYGIFN